MRIVLSDKTGIPFASTVDFEIDYQYGKVNDFELKTDYELEAGSRFHIDGTQYAGIVDMVCVSHSNNGDAITYKGRTIQGILEHKIIEPPSGQTHYKFTGDANEMLAAVIAKTGLSDYVQAESTASGININYQFYRYVDAWNGLRMALASANARLKIECSDGLHVLSAVETTTYGRAESERVFFKLESDYIPVNKLVGLGKGEGTTRGISVWYADASRNISQTQTLKGVFENAKTYVLNNEEGTALADKTKKKLIEYQTVSKADVTIPENVELDIGDKVLISSAKFNVEALTQIIDVVFKCAKGIANTTYKFGEPDFPESEV